MANREQIFCLQRYDPRYSAETFGAVGVLYIFRDTTGTRRDTKGIPMLRLSVLCRPTSTSRMRTYGGTGLCTRRTLSWCSASTFMSSPSPTGSSALRASTPSMRSAGVRREVVALSTCSSWTAPSTRWRRGWTCRSTPRTTAMTWARSRFSHYIIQAVRGLAEGMVGPDHRHRFGVYYPFRFYLRERTTSHSFPS